MAVRKIVKIDENKCDGCGLCVPSCAEGAIQIINGKARLVADNLCDGLGACLGDCPRNAITIEEREADDFAAPAAGGHLTEAGNRLENRPGFVPSLGNPHGGGGCPGSRTMEIKRNVTPAAAVAVNQGDVEVRIRPQLQQWPVQLMLVSPSASYFRGADLLVTADCVPFADPNYHLDILKGKALVVGCPKLDDLEYYVEKLAQIIELNDLKSITVAYMEVPCCAGIYKAVEMALARTGKDVPVIKVKVSLNGEKQTVR